MLKYSENYRIYHIHETGQYDSYVETSHNNMMKHTQHTIVSSSKPKRWLMVWWWCGDMETLSALLVLCEENPDGPVLRSFEVSSVVNLNKLLNKQRDFTTEWWCTWVPVIIRHKWITDRGHRMCGDVISQGFHLGIPRKPQETTYLHFADNVFTYICSYESCCIVIQISTEFVAKGFINAKQTLVHITAWRRKKLKMAQLTYTCMQYSATMSEESFSSD